MATQKNTTTINGSILYAHEKNGVRVITTRPRKGKPDPVGYLDLLAEQAASGNSPQKYHGYLLPDISKGEVYFWQSWPSMVEPASMLAVPARARARAEALRQKVETLTADKPGKFNEGEPFLFWLYYVRDIGGGKDAFIMTVDWDSNTAAKAKAQWKNHGAAFIAGFNPINITGLGNAYDATQALKARFQTRYVVAFPL